MRIDWRKTQGNLKVGIDGNPGDETFSALLRVVAAPQAKAADILAMARALKTFAVPVADLTTPRRLAGYISNTANETGGFTTFSEDLRYSAKRMAEVWPGRYRGADGKPNAKAIRLAGDPIAFANDVYGARMGNERDGIDDNDGYDYRGLGPYGLTGFDNFNACERHTGIPFTTQPGLMADPGIGTIGALSWYSRSGCNALFDAGNSKGARSMGNAGNPNQKNPEGWPRVAAYEAQLLKVIA